MGTHSPSRSTMHLILLSIFLAVSVAEPDGCMNKDSCDIKEYVQQINCPAQHNNVNEEEECKCKKSAEEECGEDFVPFPYKEMTKKKCKDLCSNFESKSCVFYRWDKAGYTNVKTCTLMSETQCKEKGPACVPYSEGCESGALEGKCSSDSDIRPKGQNCTINLPAERVSADRNGINIPWVCYDPFSREGKQLDVYTDEDVSVFNGVICETLDKCTHFGPVEADAHFVTYTCKDTTWQTEETLDESPIDDDGKLVKDLVCRINPLSVPKKNLGPDTGAELICGTPYNEEGENYTVNPPNSCAFLCDKIHVVTIQSGWADQQNGKAGWKLYVVGDPDPIEITDGNDLSCWSQRIFGHRRRG